MKSYANYNNWILLCKTVKTDCDLHYANKYFKRNRKFLMFCLGLRRDSRSECNDSRIHWRLKPPSKTIDLPTIISNALCFLLALQNTKDQDENDKGLLMGLSITFFCCCFLLKSFLPILFQWGPEYRLPWYNPNPVMFTMSLAYSTLTSTKTQLLTILTTSLPKWRTFKA